MKRDIGAEILEGLEEIAKWKKGEIELKTTKLKLPTANDVTDIRERMGLSQQIFATESVFAPYVVGSKECASQKVRLKHCY